MESFIRRLTHWRNRGYFVLGVALAVTNAEAKEVTMKLLLPRSPQSLNPYSYLSLPEWYVHSNITATLLELDQENQVVPGLAKKVTVSDDGKMYRLVLDMGRRWSDGKPITPSDVVATFSHPERHKNAQLLPKILKKGPIAEALTTEGTDTVVIRLEAAYPSLLYQLATPEFGIVDSVGLAKTKVFGPGVRTSGDYRIVSISSESLMLEPSSSGNRLDERNPGKVEFIHVPSQEKAAEMIAKGEVDFYEAQSDDVLQSAKASGMYNVIDGGLDNLATLQTRKLGKADIKAVQVFARFFDKTLLASAPKRVAERLTAITSVPLQRKPERLSADEAKKLLGGKTYRVTMTMGEDATADQLKDAEVIRSEARKIGLEIAVKTGVKGFRKHREKEDYGLTLVRMGVYAENEAELLHGYFCTGFEPYRALKKVACPDIEKATTPGTAPEVVRYYLYQAYEKIAESGKIVPLYHFPRRFLVQKRWELKGHNPLVPFPRFARFFLR